MASTDVPGPPPPYAPPQPPPYSPPSDKNSDYIPGRKGNTTIPSTYGTESLKTGSCPQSLGAPPYNPIDPHCDPSCNSTTLLISRERKPPSFFCLSLITCLCFSPLFGIIAIIFSVLSDAAWSDGDPDSARRYSQVAVSLSIVGIFISIFTLILIFATGAIRFQ